MTTARTDAAIHQAPSEHERRETGDRLSILDWDVCLETPPPRPAGRVQVRLTFRGRGQPIPLEEPEGSDDVASRDER